MDRRQTSEGTTRELARSELPEPLRVRVETFRRCRAGVAELFGTLERLEDDRRAVLVKTLKARRAMYDALDAARSEFMSYLGTEDELAILYGLRAVDLEARAAGLDLETGDAEASSPSPVELAMLGPKVTVR